MDVTDLISVAFVRYRGFHVLDGNSKCKRQIASTYVSVKSYAYL